MLSHRDAPLEPHDVWTAWNLDPILIGTVVIVVWWYARGLRPGLEPWRFRAFVGGIAAVVVALVSPVDALADTLFSGHMVQHVLLIAVAAPLLAYAQPGPVTMRGMPARLRRVFVRARRGSGLDADRIRRAQHPLARLLLFIVVTWTWHASRFYGAAVDNRWVHALEHVLFLASALAVWNVIVGASRHRADLGVGVLVVFALMLQGVALSALLTFSNTPWYDVYSSPPPAWGLDALTDQHLAGLIMWFPTGLLHTTIAIALAIRWLRDLDDTPATLRF